MANIYGFNYGSKQEKRLEASLERAGISPEEVTDLIFTHLHFDHCGGTTDYTNGVLAHVFPNAQYHVHRDHLATATQPNPREQASFLPDNIAPIAAAEDRLIRVEGDRPHYETGLELGQQLPMITHGDQRLVFVADLLPTAAHVPLVWVMGYDMFPTQTLVEKEHFLHQAANEQWWLLLEHDRHHECIRIGNIEGRWKVIETATLNDFQSLDS
jgi:glyoxylase-like metal-dependent hydrolase (beta-lactamase superfamily II)